MKKIIVCCALALSSILLTVSCQKTRMNPDKTTENSTAYDFRKDNSFIETFGSEQDQTVTSVNQRLNISELMEIAKIEDEETRKIEISLLNLPEKLDFWNNLVTYKITTGQFNSTQKQLLKDVRDAFVKPNIFANINLQEILRIQFLPLIATQLQNAGISHDQLDNIFVTGSIDSYIISGGGSTIPKIHCICNQESIFGCSGCKSTDECIPDMGCGFFGLFSCDGKCPRTK